MLNGDGNENEIKERLPLVWKTWKFRGEFKWNSSSGRWKFCGKKEYFSRYHLFPVFNEKTEIFCTICLDSLVPGFMLRQSEKLTGIL